MLPIKKILFPTDFSEPSYEALKVADELASHFSAELVLIHAVSPVPMYATPVAPSDPTSSIGLVNSYQQEMEVYAKKSLDQIIREKISKGTRAKAKVSLGDAADGIVETAADENVDLIVIATHGLTGWRRFMFGSVAEKVVRLAKCPVLTIREPEGKG